MDLRIRGGCHCKPRPASLAVSSAAQMGPVAVPRDWGACARSRTTMTHVPCASLRGAGQVSSGRPADTAVRPTILFRRTIFPELRFRDGAPTLKQSRHISTQVSCRETLLLLRFQFCQQQCRPPSRANYGGQIQPLSHAAQSLHECANGVGSALNASRVHAPSWPVSARVSTCGWLLANPFN